MINEVRIANFRAFGSQQRIPLSRITLLYGFNSSGKSSVIHALALAGQLFEGGLVKGKSLSEITPSMGRSTFDFGTFDTFVFRRELSRRVMIEMDADSRSWEGFWDILAQQGLVMPSQFKVRMEFGHPEKCEPVLTDWSVEADGQLVHENVEENKAGAGGHIASMLAATRLATMYYIGVSRTWPDKDIDMYDEYDAETPPDEGGVPANTETWWLVAYRDEVNALVNRWLGDPKCLNTPLRIFTDEHDGARFLKFHDTDYHIDFAHHEIGYGLSQVIPVLATAGFQNSAVVIDQPELHLHPRAQAELGDVFIESVRRKNNTYLLETHSETLLLRLLRRIRETTEGKIDKDSPLALYPEDLSIVYLARGQEGAIATPIEVTPDGEFATLWPDGFFPEQAKEWFS